jgi:hypothetical protein
MFEMHDQQLLVFVFYGHFYDLLPTVLVFRYCPLHSVHVEETCQKLAVFVFQGHFLLAIAHGLGDPRRFKTHVTLKHCLRSITKNSLVWCLDHFRELLPTVFGFRCNLKRLWHSVHVWETWHKTHCFHVLWIFSWAIAHCFGLLGRFLMPATCGTCLRAWQKTRRFQIYDCFVSYEHRFWDSGAIENAKDTQYMFKSYDKKNSSFLHFIAVFVR